MIVIMGNDNDSSWHYGMMSTPQLVVPTIT